MRKNFNGKIDPANLRPITFDSMNLAYLVIDEKVGNAFRDGLNLKQFLVFYAFFCEL